MTEVIRLTVWKKKLLLFKLMLKKTYCEYCHISRFCLELHHIVYKSEQPNHKELNNPLNLITACRRCHEKLHGDKSLRNELVEDRGLEALFNCKLLKKYGLR